MTPELQYPPYRAPYYENGEHLVGLFQEASPDAKISSSLEVKAKEGQLSCGKEEEITITYTVVGEDKGVVDLMYLVRGPAGPALTRDLSAGFCTVASPFYSAGPLQGKHPPSRGRKG